MTPHAGPAAYDVLPLHCAAAHHGITFVNHATGTLRGCALLDVLRNDIPACQLSARTRPALAAAREVPLARAILGDEVVLGARWCVLAAPPVCGFGGARIRAVLTMLEAVPAS